MKHLLLWVLTLCTGIPFASAQNLDSQNIQIHGYATQSAIASSHNNYLSADTRNGSLQWTEAAANITDQVTERLRIGLQVHYLNLGQFGGNNVSWDWALGDFKVNQWVGVRAGKVKIRWGLYNDTQDADPGYMWSLLPESIYSIDYRETNLSQLGAEIYGKAPLGKHGGELTYSGYYGDYYLATDDGYMETYHESGTSFTDHPWGKTPGFDLRWKTPVKGLQVGGSLMLYDLKGTTSDGNLRQPLTYWPTYYGQYDRGKLTLSGQYMKLVQYTNVTQTGSPTSSSVQDERAWFAMASYHINDKLQVGAYHSRFLMASAEDHSDPASYSHEWVAATRYDFNNNFYGKIEGHYMDGNAVGFYGVNNPNGLRPHMNLLVAKIGFVF